MQTEKMKELGILSIRKVTNARMNFDFAMTDVEVLLNLHDQQSGGKTGKPNRKLEVYKRAGIILTVTAWEAFIEDTITLLFERRLNEVKSPDDLPNIFEAIVDSLLSKQEPGKEETRKKVRKQIREGDWKTFFVEKLRKDVKALNTPTRKKIQPLSLRYLEIDVTENWKWRGATNQKVCEKLDELICLRGSLVHRGKEIFEEKTGATRINLVSAIKLVKRLADRTEEALGIKSEDIVL